MCLIPELMGVQQESAPFLLAFPIPGHRLQLCSTRLTANPLLGLFSKMVDLSYTSVFSVICGFFIPLLASGGAEIYLMSWLNGRLPYLTSCFNRLMIATSHM